MKLIDALIKVAENPKRHIETKDGIIIPLNFEGQIRSDLNSEGFDIIEPEPEKKQGRWEYCELVKKPEFWGFYRENGNAIYSLAEACGMVGFGGIELFERQGRYFPVLKGLNKHGIIVNLSDASCVRPATPNRVRFWVED